MKKYLLLTFVAVAALATSCKKNNDPAPAPVELKTLSLGRDTLTLTVGQTFQLDLKFTPTDYDQSLIRLTSTDTTVLTVTNGGKITTKKAGISIIKATNDKQTISVTCLVNVKPKVVIDSLKVGLLAYFPFNNSGVDSSGKGNNGMVYNISSVPNRFGTPNSAYYFDGFSSFIKVADKPELRLNNTDFTFNAWVKMTDYNQSYGSSIMIKRIPDVNNGWNFSVRGYAGAPEGRVSFGQGGGSTILFSNTPIGLNSWNMISCVYTLKDKQLKVYINGVLDITADNLSTPNASVTASMYIGRDDPSVPSNGYFFQGSLDDLRIYNRVLKQQDITKLYNLTY